MSRLGQSSPSSLASQDVKFGPLVGVVCRDERGSTGKKVGVVSVLEKKAASNTLLDALGVRDWLSDDFKRHETAGESGENI